MLFFETNARTWSVAGINNRFIRQNKKLIGNILNQLLMISAGKIGAADASVKEYITTH